MIPDLSPNPWTRPSAVERRQVRPFSDEIGLWHPRYTLLMSPANNGTVGFGSVYPCGL